MPNIKPILFVIGALLSILSVAMVIPAFADLAVNNPDWKNFALSSFLTAFVGVSLVLTNKNDNTYLTVKQAFILTTLSWISLTAFAALPLLFSSLNLSYTDAFFEAMSGVTTTGATVLSGLDAMPPGILLWRALLHWIGGIGIIVVAIAILPMLKIGGMQLFRTESSDKSDKILPRTAQVSGTIATIYLFFTLLCAILLWMMGMSEFDAICHAMSTVSTGGFSTHDASIGYFDNAAIEAIVIIFMIMGALPHVLYIQIIRGKYNAIFLDGQVRWFLFLLILAILVIATWLSKTNNINFTEALRQVAFNIISVVTTTGFASADYASWGGFAITTIFLLSVVGGCTGSTSGGIKIFRYQMLYQIAKLQVNNLIHPHAVFRPRFNNKPISETVSSSVMGFFILFAFCFLVTASLLSLTGLDYVSSMSGAAATLANVGPGLGEIIGPMGNYQTIPDSAKWLLSFAMLIGRLELFTVLVLFSPYFWRD